MQAVNIRQPLLSNMGIPLTSTNRDEVEGDMVTAREWLKQH